MGKRTKLLSVLPWTGGLNTSLDEGMIGSQDLVAFSNIVYGPKSSKLKRPGINADFDDQANGTDNIICGSDFWYESGTSKTHKYVGVTETGVMYSWTTSGTRSTITPTAAAEVWSAVCPAKASLGTSQYFYLNTANDAIQYYCWFDKSGGDADPAPASTKTGIRVDVSGDTTATQVGARLATAIDALAGFIAVNSSGTVTITNASNGWTSDAINVNVSSFTITTTTQGSSAAWTTPSVACMQTYNNNVLMACDGTGNNIMYWNGTNSKALDLSTHPSYLAGDPRPPSASVLRPHLGRMWANDKSNKDRIHWSGTFNQCKWQGAGDSGAMDIGVGDGDPIGIVAIFPTFKGELFVAKSSKLYRISGYSPETFTVQLVSDSVGAESHNGVTSVDTEDVYWVSRRGIHSLNTTVNFGDFESKFISYKIQQDFNDNFTKSRLTSCQAAYIPDINSVAFAVTLSDSTFNNDIYLYNVQYQAWYLWPSVNCEAMFLATDSDRKRLYFGTSLTRLSKSFAGTNYDSNTSGAAVSIPYALETGMIFPQENPSAISGFKSFSLVHRPVGNQTITVNFSIDGYPSQALSFNVLGSVDLLGSTFILGVSLLGGSAQLAPHTLSVDGYGRSFKVAIAQNSIDESAEIQGFQVEYEEAGDQQEVSG